MEKEKEETVSVDQKGKKLCQSFAFVPCLKSSLPDLVLVESQMIHTPTKAE